MGEYSRFKTEYAVRPDDIDMFQIHFTETNKVSCDGWFDYVLIDIKTGRSSVVNEEMIKKYSI